jgi:hypothetical protein
MRHILLLGCFSAVSMVKSDWDQKNGFAVGTDSSDEGYELTNVASGRKQWLPKDEVDRSSAMLPDNFADYRPEDRPWLAERALHSQRIVELTAELANRKLHYQQNGTTDTFAQNFIEPHIEALRQRVAELTAAMRCID